METTCVQYWNRFCPTIFGTGALGELVTKAKEFKMHKILFVTEKALMDLKVSSPIKELLENAGFEVVVFDDIIADPNNHLVTQGAALAKETGIDGIVAVGGGSSMDCAKGIAMMTKNEGTIEDYYVPVYPPDPDRVKKGFPLITIPTTAGTGSEVTASAVITDEKTHFKSTIFSYYNLPKFAILDPELIMTAPAHIAAACGVDALIHAMEAYLSNNANPFSDCFAEKAMELIGANLRRFVANRHDEKAACAMMVGSNFAGIAFAWARLGNIHALSHPVSGFFGVAHGVANSVLMPAVMEYNALADIGRYEKIYNYVSVDKEPVKDFKPQMLVDLVTELNKELGIPENLRAVGVTEDKIHAMAVDAMKSGNIPANPRETTLDDVIALYHKAY